MEQIVNLDRYSEYETEETQEIDEVLSDEVITISERKRDVSFGDIFVFQLILCVLMILALVIMNITDSENAHTVINSFKNEVDKVFDYKQELNNVVTSIFRFINVEG